MLIADLVPLLAEAVFLHHICYKSSYLGLAGTFQPVILLCDQKEGISAMYL